VGQSDHVKWGDLESGLGEVDLPFLKECFDRLLLNFTWWVNRKDPSGHNVFEDPHWPLARPYRRLAAESVADVTTARKARGVSEPKSP